MAHMPSDDTPGGFDEMASSRILGRVTAGTGVVEELTSAQATTLIDTVTTGLKGLAPSSPGGTTRFLRADATWSVPPGEGGGGGGLTPYYNVLDYDLVADGTTDNKAAFSTLVDDVIAAGGGTIYFPAAPLSYHFEIGGPGDRDIKVIQGAVDGGVVANLRILGDGRGSMLTWGGDAGNADAHFMSFKNGVQYFTAESFSIKQKDAIVNPDPSEHHHLFALVASLYGNVEYFRFINVDFGLCKGDAINVVGGTNPSAAVDDAAGYAATLAAGAMAGPFTAPLAPQRVAVKYPDNLTSGNTTTTVDAAAKTYTRLSGSFTGNGFAVGQTVTWSGFTNAGNNATDTIAVLTATVMTVTGGGALVNEAGTGNEVCVGPEWDGGGFTITGTNRQDGTITETLPAGVNDRYFTTQEFKTITGVEKLGAAGLCTQKVTIGYVYMSQHVSVTNCTFNGYDYAGSNPDYGYRSAFGVQRLTGHIRITNNFMTGAGDQLIDFEPTGNGNIGPYVIEYNTLIASNPHSGSNPGGLAITFVGNGNDPAGGSLLLEVSSFSNNHIYGRVQCAKLATCKVNNNILICDDGPSEDGTFSFIDTINDVDVIGNKIYSHPNNISKPFYVSATTPYHANGLRIRNNTVHWYEQTGIKVDGGISVEICDNRLVYLGTDVNTDVGILYQPADAPDRVVISGNLIEGDREGGTLQYGIQYNPGGVAVSVLHVCDNRGAGCQTGGVRFVTPGAGSYATVPVAYGNEFPGATTALVIGAGIGVMVGGNSGTWALYTGDEASPNDLSVIDGVALGSIYRGVSASVLYRKNAAGANGWVSGFPVVGELRGCSMVYATAATVQIATGTVSDVDGLGVMVLASTKTANIAASGANGLDTGAEAANTWYALWAIGKLDGTTAALLSTSATAPTMPTNYVLKRRVGWVRNDSASDFYKFYQRGAGVDRQIVYDEDQATLLALSAGGAGTFTDVDLSAWVPPGVDLVALQAKLTGAAGGAADAAWLRPNGATATDGPCGLLGDFTVATGPVISRIEIPTDTNRIIEYMVADTNDDLDLLVLGYADEI